MIKISKNQVLIIIALLLALVMAFFPTSEFIKPSYIIDTQLKQQHFNEAGIFTVSPFEAAKYFSNSQSRCFWIDLRDVKEFEQSHLKLAINETMKQLENSSFYPDDVVLVYANNTEEAQNAVAYLRQVSNVRAFAIKGGFSAVKEYLIDPIGLSVSNKYSDKDLEALLQVRNKISGEKGSSAQSLESLKGKKSTSIREGC